MAKEEFLVAEITPIGMFSVQVFQTDNIPPDYITQIMVPAGRPLDAISWIEAAATLAGYVARHSDIGYEQTLELITERTMRIREGCPNPPNSQTLSDEPETPKMV